MRQVTRGGGHVTHLVILMFIWPRKPDIHPALHRRGQVAVSLQKSAAAADGTKADPNNGFPVTVEFPEYALASLFETIPQVIIRMFGPVIPIEMHWPELDAVKADLCTLGVENTDFGALSATVNGDDVLLVHNCPLLCLMLLIRSAH